MKLRIDTSRSYALALEGGGAKGAYQIGAWKALREAGVKSPPSRVPPSARSTARSS